MSKGHKEGERGKKDCVCDGGNESAKAFTTGQVFVD